MRINLYLILLSLPAAIFAQATDLFISEYIEGSAYNKAIEIYNGTGYSVDLSAYSLQQDKAGNDTFSVTLNLKGYLGNDEVYVLTRPSADESLIAHADTLSGLVTTFNGDDQIRLLRDGVEIDHIGISGDKDFGKDVTFVRRSYIYIPKSGEQDPRNNGEWDAYEKDYFNNLGTHIYSAGFGDLKPQIIHQDYQPEYPDANEDIVVSIKAHDDSSGLKAYLHFSVNGEDSVLQMNSLDSVYWTTIPHVLFSDGDRLEFFSIIEDISGQKDSTVKEKIFTGISPIKNIKKTDEEGVLLYPDYHARIEGILTTDSTVFRDFAYIQDKSSGIKWNKINTPDLQFPSGQLISLTGKINQENGETEIITNKLTDVIDHDQQNLFSPVEVSVSLLNQNSDLYEGELVMLKNVKVIENQWPDFLISDSNDNKFTLYIHSDTDIDYTTLPAFSILTISGIIVQSDSLLPYNAGYKLMPRSKADIEIISVIEAFNEKGPHVFKWTPPYPNPFNSRVMIHFDLAFESADFNTQLIIYNNSGQEVIKLINKILSPGSHRILWDASDMASGTYFIKLSCAEFCKISRVILLK